MKNAITKRQFVFFFLSLYLITADIKVCLAQQFVFEDEVRSKWKAYEEFSHNLQGLAKGVGTLPSGSPYTYLYHYKQNRECACFSKVENFSEPSKENWFISNPRYSARIKKNSDNPMDTAILSYSDDRNALLIGGKSSVRSITFLETSPHFSFGAVPLSEIVADSSFHTKNGTKDRYNGLELYRVDYEYNLPSTKSKARQAKMKGSLYFDPMHHWCVHRDHRVTQRTIEGSVETEEITDDHYEITVHSSGFPLVKARNHSLSRKDYRNHNPPEETNAKSRIDYEWEIDDHVPDSDFTLSAFGLPEPGSDTVQKPMPPYVWIFIAAALCFVLALVFRYLMRRKRLASAN